MEKLLLLFLPLSFLFSCNNAPSPSETAGKFIKALSSSDVATASLLASADTRAVLNKAKRERQTANPEESFQFAAFTETVSDKKAQVKNQIISVPLVKEDGGWKVVLNETLLDEIQGREERLVAAKTKWDALLKAYEDRLQVLKEYINYKKGLGAPSPNVKTLSDAINGISPAKEQTREALVAYVQKQWQLDKIIDNALEPSLAANTDLSLNYFLQISNAGDRIKAAETDYQSAAEAAHSPVYVSLPLREPGMSNASRR